MLENLREKIQTVQNDFTHSIRGLAISAEAKQEVRTKLGLQRNVHKDKVNMNAGSELLHRYQTQWQQMHELNETNAKTAEEVAKALAKIESYSKRQDNCMNELLTHLSSLPQIIESIESIEKDLHKSMKLFAQTEQILTDLQLIREEEEFDKLKLDQHLKIQLYKENKNSELEVLRSRMAVEHTNRVQEYERQQQIVLKERQEAFQKVFEEELKQYKTCGRIERKEVKESAQRTTSIEEVVIEAEQSDEAALEQFLQE